MTSQSLTSIYYALIYPYLTYGCVLWGNNYEAPLSQLVRLQNKAIRIINNVPLRDHITPHYVNLGLLKFPDIVKLYTCQLLYDHLIDAKPSKYTLSLVSEQHNYATRSTSLQHLNPGFSRINIRKFCPTQEGEVNLGLGTSGRIRAKKSEVSGNRDVTSMLSREV